MQYRESLLMDRRGGGTNRRALQASRRLELAMIAYQEFLLCLSRMVNVTEADRIPDLELEETSEIVEERLRLQATAAENIVANIFYVSEYQDVYPILLTNFNEAVQSR
ncbi:unnamed protein product [Echinostoma caproni]|uniref:DH domain-containing protein n=1 Tax=Echinostoma caproni TaxID=27848 RepID=A0A183BDL3_9TREM|nr:unnamed protein product [Echinostoma caproni]